MVIIIVYLSRFVPTSCEDADANYKGGFRISKVYLSRVETTCFKFDISHQGYTTMQTTCCRLDTIAGTKECETILIR